MEDSPGHQAIQFCNTTYSVSLDCLFLYKVDFQTNRATLTSDGASRFPVELALKQDSKIAAWRKKYGQHCVIMVQPPFSKQLGAVQWEKFSRGSVYSAWFSTAQC